ncbi:MAG: tRNA (guanosine(46)-N7)-methyltransferase TrmB [Bacteroidia bacterium]|nr:tRNA (guanosine(46)-N7)-methyltransferase TrmB [Bacteroidia bacterium]
MRKKAIRKEQFNNLPNCFRFVSTLKGNWRTYFRNTNPIYLELGCGKAEFSIELAKRFPQQNWIGMDIKTDRLGYAGCKAAELGLSNILFLHAAAAKLADIFIPTEITEVWLTFPDPHPKKKARIRRMTYRSYLVLFAQLFGKDTRFHLKTDNSSLFDFTLTELALLGIKPDYLTRNTHQTEAPDSIVRVLTTFEKNYISRGLPIHYLTWTFYTINPIWLETTIETFDWKSLDYEN